MNAFQVVISEKDNEIAQLEDKIIQLERLLAQPITPIILENAKDIEVKMKDPLSIQEIIEHLKARISFTEEEQKYAEIFLNQHNYYRFSIYPKLLPLTDKQYSFSNAVELYDFDAFLRNSLSPFISIIENMWKGTIVKSLCQEYKPYSYYSAQCYLDIDLYNNEEWGRNIIKRFTESIAFSQSIIVKHHKKHKKNCIPLWVLIEELTFGELETFITQLKPTYIKKWAVSTYNERYNKVMKGWLSSIRHLRNKVSHNSRLYNGHFTSVPAIIKADRKIYFSNIEEQQNKLFSCLYVLSKLLIYCDINDQKRWNQFLEELESTIDGIGHILELEKGLGFYHNWLEILKIQEEDC